MNSWRADNLLVSSVNGGGVFLLHGGEVERWSRVDTTGVTLFPGGALLARQADGVAQLRWWNGRDAQRVDLMQRSLDLHDLHWHAGRLYVVATQINGVFELDADFVEQRHWLFSGEEDSQHINSICVHDGRILASRFGRFLEHRGYKGATQEAGDVFDVETGESLLAGLSQPHSLASHGGWLWLCDSEARTLRRFRDFRPDGAFPLDGYARGLAFGDGVAYVGLSRSRNAEPGSIATACVLVLDMRDMAELARIELPANEVYDIRVVPQAIVPDLRAAAFADAVAEYDTQVDLRNRAVAATASNETALATALHTANLRIADLEAEAAAGSARLAEAERGLALANAHASETAAWAGLLEADSARLRAWLAGPSEAQAGRAGERDRLRRALDQVLAGHADARRDLASQSDFIALVMATRSWRWTRCLRQVEPVPPPRDDGREAADSAVAAAATAVLAAADALHALPTPPPAPSRADIPVSGLAFAVQEAPLVSIVVASYGGFARTRACLESIAMAGAAVPFEVLLVEDASGEVEMDRFRHVPGLRYLRHPQNLGFLRSMNAVLGDVRGEFVHLLNNDVRVTPGWLDALLRTFAIFGDCGMAGSRLVYPDGRLQEAGAVVWSDGDGWNVGRGDDAAAPRYATVREVDYVSGASVLLRTSVLRALGGFDERYAPAYYEDTDLAFRLRAQGLRTLYQAGSTVIHDEGGSHGTDPSAGGKAWQARNRDVFLERWSSELRRTQLPRGEHPFLARSRAQLRKIVLVADRHPPHTDRDAGSRAVWEFMRVLQLQGLDVRFWSFEPEPDQRYLDGLAMHGIELMGQGDAATGFDDWLREHGRYLDYVVLSRPAVADALVDSVRRHSAASVLYYGHDIHHLRMASQRSVEQDAVPDALVERMRGQEESVWRRSDAILYPAQAETDHVARWLAEHDGHGRAATIPLFACDGLPAAAGSPEGRDRLLFVGGFAHAPNADGIGWFLDEVWPLVRDRAPRLGLVIAGSDPPPSVQARASGRIAVTGTLSEEELVAAYGGARVAIAPLRFGAGVKGKVLEAMRHGVPCVTTTVGAQGLEANPELRVADDAAAMAERILALAHDDGQWRTAVQGGYDFLRDHFSSATLWASVSPFIDPAPYPDVATRLASVPMRARG